MNMNNQMEESEASILHTYNRFPVVFERGEGVHLYDSEGSKYLDFAAGPLLSCYSINAFLI